jgi:hypothetical protein
MSDFNTYDVEVTVSMKVSAYDKEHALEVAREILLPVAGVQYVAQKTTACAPCGSCDIDIVDGPAVYDIAGDVLAITCTACGEESIYEDWSE